MTKSQSKRMLSLQPMGFSPCRTTPEWLRAQPADLVCSNRYEYGTQYVTISRRGTILRRETVWHELKEA